MTLYPTMKPSKLKYLAKWPKKAIFIKALNQSIGALSCETALAEAEIEYAEKKSHTIYVKFPLSR